MNDIRIALIPAYEPNNKLIEIVDELINHNYVVVIVNDGSGETYSNIFASCADKAAVVSHDTNRGKGAAIKTGIKYIKNNYQSPYTVVTIDSDGQHRVIDALDLTEHAENERYTLFLGSRDFGKSVPLRSLMGNTITRAVFHVSTGLKINDTQTGLRAFSDQLSDEMLAINGDRYEYEMNVLLQFSRNKISIKEVPIETLYYDSNKGSHFNTIRDSYRIYKEILKFSAASFASFIVDYSLYSLIVAILGTQYITVANLTARLISGTFNYNVNKRLVFKDNATSKHPVIRYVILAGAIICGNTIILNYLVNNLAVNQYLAKVITELIFFIISWLVQRTLIFKRKVQS